ncbi:Com family DNA-binding transcriptional regulator [Parathalassolituus penaei]|uniref:Com family DNA-binding transcriptional regulator n=1 Tax=Parathalassolituus penaei TaxID=2997323 RepID=UPI003D179000
MREIRCSRCNKLLCRFSGNAHLEIKCSRCGNLSTERHECQQYEQTRSHRRYCGKTGSLPKKQ